MREIASVSGFASLQMACPLIETLEQFFWGVKASDGPHQVFYVGALLRLFSDALSTTHLPQIELAERFYDGVRCGILHQCELKDEWTVRRVGRLFSDADEGILVVDHIALVDALDVALKTYVADLSKDDPPSTCGQHVLANCAREYGRKPKAYAQWVASYTAKADRSLREAMVRKMTAIASFA